MKMINDVDLVKALRNIAEIGIVNAKRDKAVIEAAADRIEEMDERIAIMQESMEAQERILKGRGLWPFPLNNSEDEHKHSGLITED